MPVSFSVGETSQSFAVGILEDETAEGTEAFVAVIASPNAMTNCALLVQISDNDGNVEVHVSGVGRSCLLHGILERIPTACDMQWTLLIRPVKVS